MQKTHKCNSLLGRGGVGLIAHGELLIRKYGLIPKNLPSPPPRSGFPGSLRALKFGNANKKMAVDSTVK
jgi:hypothetical protein